MSNEPEYTPAKVWTWNKANGGRFASINRPIAGPTHRKARPHQSCRRAPKQLQSDHGTNGNPMCKNDRGRPQTLVMTIARRTIGDAALSRRDQGVRPGDLPAVAR
jgi:hypothetical protein